MIEEFNFLMNQFSIKQGILGTVEKLCQSESIVNEPDNKYMFPIHHAVLANNLDIVSILLDYGAEIDSTDFNEKTALHYAYSVGNKDIVNFLIEKGASTFARDYILSFSFISNFGNSPSFYSNNK